MVDIEVKEVMPGALVVKAGGLELGLGFPEEYGGTQVDNFMWIVAVQELARAGAGGVSASLKSNSIGAPPIARALLPPSGIFPRTPTT